MIKFKIVKIINEYKVVVNGGSANEIEEGDILEVFEPGEEVVDPDSGISLGTLDLIKAKLRVVDLFANMCVCENRDGEVQKNLSEVLSFQTITKRIPLNVDATEISGGYEGHSRKIRIGDLVRKCP